MHDSGWLPIFTLWAHLNLLENNMFQAIPKLSEMNDSEIFHAVVQVEQELAGHRGGELRLRARAALRWLAGRQVLQGVSWWWSGGRCTSMVPRPGCGSREEAAIGGSSGSSSPR